MTTLPSPLRPDTNIDVDDWIADDGTRDHVAQRMGASGGHAQTKRPLQGIVLIVTDDERYDEAMSSAYLRTFFGAEMLAKGTHFRNYITVRSRCSPSRGCMYSSQYEQNNHIRDNDLGTPHFDLTDTVFTWLYGSVGDRLFQTGWVGKVLNLWESGSLASHNGVIPTGLDYFVGRSYNPNGSARYGYQNWHERYDEDGVILAGYPTIYPSAGVTADQNLGYPYDGDSVITDAVAALDDFLSRPDGDSRQGLPFFLTVAIEQPHNPTTPIPPIPTPDTYNRAGRIASYAQWVPPFFDYAILSGTATATTASTLTDNSKSFTTNELVGMFVQTGNAWGNITSNTATEIRVDSWKTLLTLEDNITPPAPTAYNVGTAYPNIDVQDGAIQGGHGLYSLTPGTLPRAERQRQQSNICCDDLVASLMARTDDAGITDDVVWIYVSDNSFSRLENGDISGKDTAFESNIKGACVIRGPGFGEGVVSDARVCNVDIGMTIAELAGATPTRTTDGKSVIPAVADPTTYDTRALLITGGEPGGRLNHGVRTKRWKYFYFPTNNASTDAPWYGVNEFLFDLDADPFELFNIAGETTYDSITVATLMTELRGIADDLFVCSGASCDLTWSE